MNNNPDLETELQEFKKILEASGVAGALKFLSQKTPHRYTGIYKYDGDTLRNIALYDSYDQQVQKGEDAPMSATYCSLVRQEQRLEIKDAETDNRVKGKIITPVVSYCGALMKDAEGNPFGTVCHFDMKRCEEPISHFPLLEEATTLLFHHINDKPGTTGNI
jgi:hypothetical protein